MSSWLPKGTRIPTYGLIQIPYMTQWNKFIGENPDLSPHQSSPKVVEMDVAKFSLMSWINLKVNSSIKYRKDVKDSWKLPETHGDCEDFAIAKLNLLIKAGWPRGALRLTICDVVGLLKKQRHAVLQIDTDHGTWVLDNRKTYPKIWSYCIDIKWLYREYPGEMFAWQRLSGRRTRSA